LFFVDKCVVEVFIISFFRRKPSYSFNLFLLVNVLSFL